MFPACLTTYQDVMDHLLDYLGTSGAGQGIENRDCRRAILNAYREFSSVTKWAYYYQYGVINCNGSFTDGTVQYTQSTRTLTLTPSASTGWPAWAGYGTVCIANTAYQVASVVDGLNLILDVNNNPGANLAAGTAYTLYQDTYPLPADWLAGDQLVALGLSIAYPEYVHPRQWLIPQQLLQSPATPRRYTITSDPYFFGRMAIRFHPAPDQPYHFSQIYTRRPRPLHYDKYQAGTVSGASASQGVTGVGTVWTAQMLGASIRFSPDAINYPDGPSGTNPFQEEHVITTVNSPTSLGLDTPLVYNYTSQKYRISDPVDIEEGAMLTAFLRCCESQEAITRRMKNVKDARAAYKEALVMAMEADSRDSSTRRAGHDRLHRMRLAYYPGGPDVS